jgi:hypothetical protein
MFTLLKKKKVNRNNPCFTRGNLAKRETEKASHE